jgi:beta-phosphoglucomutase-like phosphatase (HAD superfamily)
LLSRLGWLQAGVIDGWIATDHVKHGRPAPDMIRALMERFDVQESACVVKVGDTPADLEEGFAADCGLVVGVTNGSHTAAELRSHRHHALIGSVAELPELLSRGGQEVSPGTLVV